MVPNRLVNGKDLEDGEAISRAELNCVANGTRVSDSEIVLTP